MVSERGFFLIIFLCEFHTKYERFGRTYTKIPTKDADRPYFLHHESVLVSLKWSQSSIYKESNFRKGFILVLNYRDLFFVSSSIYVFYFSFLYQSIKCSLFFVYMVSKRGFFLIIFLCEIHTKYERLGRTYTKIPTKDADKPHFLHQ